MVLPHAFVDFARPINEFAPTGPFAIYPVTQIVITVGVNKSTVAMINIILELTFVDNLVNLLAHALNTTIWTNLTDDEFAVSALAELEILVNWLAGIGNDVLNIEWSELVPFLLDGLQSLSRLLFFTVVNHDGRILWPHVRWLIVS